MARYFMRAPKSFWVEDEFFNVADSQSLTADGNAIWRAPNPIGFGRDEEW